MDKNLKPELIKFGFDIDDDFINNMALKNINYLSNQIYKSPIIFNELNQDLKPTSNIIIKKCNANGDNMKKFSAVSFLGKGSYNNVFSIMNIETKKEYAFRFPLKALTKIDDLIDLYIETFIHSFLSVYEKIYLPNNHNILKFKSFGFDVYNNYISTITYKMDGNLYDILNNKHLEFDIKLKILMKSLIQIICLIEHLQDKFKFVHNDLKANNIFYKIIDFSKGIIPDNLYFYIADFGASQLVINDKLIYSNTNLAKNKLFNKRKDIHTLINSLYYSFNNAEWIFNFFGKFKLNPLIINNHNEFIKVYYLDIDEIDELYEPKNFREYLTSEFKIEIKCIEELDIIKTATGTKYKIHY